METWMMMVMMAKALPLLPPMSPPSPLPPPPPAAAAASCIAAAGAVVAATAAELLVIAGWLEVDVTTLSSSTWSSELSQVELRANTFKIEQSPGSRGLPSIDCVPPLVACFNEFQADKAARELPCLLVQDGSANGWLHNHPFGFYGIGHTLGQPAWRD